MRGEDRQRAAEVLEHPGEDRNYKDEHKRGRQDGQDEDYDGVGHGALDLAPEIRLLLQLLRDAEENLAEDAPGLPGPDHLW